MKIAISTESAADLPKELLKEFNIHTIPYSVALGLDVKKDGEFPVTDIYEHVKKTKQLPKTSAVNQYQFEEHFKKLLKDYDAIIHLTLSSEMSSAYRNALLASEEFKDKVFIIDSRSLSTGIALLTLYACDLLKQGLSVQEIVDKVNARRDAVRATFIASNVDYLYKGGRCSKLAFLGANIFHICPEIHVKDGKMDAGKKYRGKANAVFSQYTDDIFAGFVNPDLTRIFLTNSVLEDPSILDLIRERLKAKGFKYVYDAIAGSTIASHCGPNCIGIIYINEK